VTVTAQAGEEHVEFSVSDTGRGIPEQYLSRIFDPFFRVPGQEADTGTGLGLSIVKEIVEAHGGSVSVKSRVVREPPSLSPFRNPRQKPIRIRMRKETIRRTIFPFTSGRTDHLFKGV